jgi:hypothetical protein
MFLALPAVSRGDEAFFERKIRPVLAGTCFRCHGGERVAGKLRVDSLAALLKGGGSGPALVPGAPDKSLLVRALRHADDVVAMPPGKRLPDAVVNDFAEWIRSGASWPKAATTAGFLSKKHWAFQPLRAIDPPADPARAWLSPIDRFLAVKFREAKLKPLGRADRRTLIRRVTYDLTGLPPTPEEVDAFIGDTRPDAYARVVERLLASPSYGEKWGRHWLDLVRYADTAGETADFPVPEAWRYRDYVVRAFNEDVPYDRFLKEQLAGDILGRRESGLSRQQYADRVVATGYLAIARRFGFDSIKDHFLTLEDTIDVFGKSMLGLTVGCARCHDHKYDPITSDDYYALYGIFDSAKFPFAGCEKDRTPRDLVPLVSPDEIAAVIRKLDEEVHQRETEMEKPNEEIRAAAGKPAWLTVTGDIPNGGAQGFAEGKGAAGLGTIKVRKGDFLQLTILPKANHGADSTLIEWEISEQGGRRRVWNLTREVLAALQEGKRIAVGWHFLDVSGTPAILTTFVPDAMKKKGLHVWRGPADTPSVFANTTDKLIPFLTVKLPAKAVAAHPGPRGGVAIAWESPFDGVVAVKGRVQDIDPSGGDGIAWTLTHRPGYGASLALVRRAATARNEAKQKQQEYPRSLPGAYAVSEGKAHDARMHKRGDPATLGKTVPRRFLEVLGGQRVPAGAGSGRLELANWLVDVKNPLTARVMVNRIWQHHFGHGIVRTPSDFGTRGSPPSHPELLDWLATRFIQSGWSIKALHRLIVHSEAYQRKSEETERLQGSDPGNVYLARFSRRRLSAEEIRDSVLLVSGTLDRTPAGAHPFPPARTWGFTQHAPFQAVYDHDRRSIYLMTQRIKRHPFLGLFDGADASSSTAERHTTTVATQALFFLNDPFIHARARSLADRLMALPDERSRQERLARVLFGRSATATEQALSERFRAGYAKSLAGGNDADRARGAWSAWVRVMLASNEFLHVD